MATPTALLADTMQRPSDPGPLFGNLGRYRIERELGAGGMGRVYAAFDPVLERRVALKVLHACGEDASARIMREARAMARIVHPNVVTVHDVGCVEGRDYIAMELIDGETLDAWLHREKRGRREILAAFAGAGHALAAAHTAGLVHRDFKPHNVLRGNDGRIVVTDFGLARSVAVDDHSTVTTRAASPLDHVTAAGHVVGTPAYMAPEQWRGEPTSAATDQFAFCVALWEALTGARPYKSTTAEELRVAVARGPESLERSGISRSLARILVRGLEVDPSRRWPDLEVLLARLRAPRRLPRIALAVQFVALGFLAAALVVTTLAVILSRDDRHPPHKQAQAIAPVVKADAGPGVPEAEAEIIMDRVADLWERAAEIYRATDNCDELAAALDRWIDAHEAEIEEATRLFATIPEEQGNSLLSNRFQADPALWDTIRDMMKCPDHPAVRRATRRMTPSGH